jgi:pteridine reductase
MNHENTPVALITGVNRRIGEALCRQFHRQGFSLAIHHGPRSATVAGDIADTLNGERPGSATCFAGDLGAVEAIEALADSVLHHWGRLDVLVNNASRFYPTPLATADDSQWKDLMGSNLKGPFFLSRALAPALKASRGAIINIGDINARQPLKDYSLYCIAKAGNHMLTRSLALELAPEVRVNGIAPGSILWPEGTAAMDDAGKAETLDAIPLQRSGSPDDIAALATLMAMDATYITGQVIAVDGGKSLAGKRA